MHEKSISVHSVILFLHMILKINIKYSYSRHTVAVVLPTIFCLVYGKDVTSPPKIEGADNTVSNCSQRGNGYSPTASTLPTPNISTADGSHVDSDVRFDSHV